MLLLNLWINPWISVSGVAKSASQNPTNWYSEVLSIVLIPCLTASPFPWFFGRLTSWLRSGLRFTKSANIFCVPSVLPSFTNIISRSKNFCLFYSLSFATLLYPVSGTPYAYLHAYTFSLIGLMLFFMLYNSKYDKFLFFIPLIL